MKNALKLDTCFTPPSAFSAVVLQTLHTLRCIRSLAHHAKCDPALVHAALVRDEATRYRMMQVVCGPVHPYSGSGRQAEVILAFGKALNS